jgi:hypothetical protein
MEESEVDILERWNFARGGKESGIFLLVHNLLFFSFIIFVFICPIRLMKWKHLNIGPRFASFFSCATYLFRVTIEYF